MFCEFFKLLFGLAGDQLAKQHGRVVRLPDWIRAFMLYASIARKSPTYNLTLISTQNVSSFELDRITENRQKTER